MLLNIPPQCASYRISHRFYSQSKCFPEASHKESHSHLLCDSVSQSSNNTRAGESAWLKNPQLRLPPFPMKDFSLYSHWGTITFRFSTDTKKPWQEGQLKRQVYFHKDLRSFFCCSSLKNSQPTTGWINWGWFTGDNLHLDFHKVSIMDHGKSWKKYPSIWLMSGKSAKDQISNSLLDQ